MTLSKLCNLSLSRTLSQYSPCQILQNVPDIYHSGKGHVATVFNNIDKNRRCSQWLFLG